MDWMILIIFSGAVVLASIGLITLLFAEIFKGRRQSESLTRKESNAPAAGITAEERESLTGSSASGTLISRASFLFRRKPAPSAAEGDLAGGQKPATHQ